MVQAGSIHHVVVSGSGQAGEAVVPRQLPGAVRDFTGRVEHLAALNALLSSSTEQAGVPGAVVISAIDGAGGIGKTALAVHWAHRVQHRFPDGTLHVNLRGYGPGDPTTPEQALDGFLHALGIPAEAIPAGPDAKAAMYRSRLASRRVLIVLDNANHPDQVRPLLPGAQGCVVVVTSRDSLTGLVITDGAQRINLDLLTEDEAHHLVVGILGADRAAVESAAVAELVRLCARLPLALRIAATRIASSPHATVADVVAELTDDRTRVDALSRGGDERTALRAVFDHSYQRLTPEQANLFRRLGLHPGPEISVLAAAAVADIDPRSAKQLLSELASAHMITAVASGRFRFHDLLRTYAAEVAKQHDSRADRVQALDRLLGWYAHTAHTCDTVLYPVAVRLPRHPQPPRYPMQITTDTDAATWLEAERDNLLTALRTAVDHDMFLHTFALADASRFLVMRSRWDEQLAAYAMARDAASRCGDRQAEAIFHDFCGEALRCLHRREESVAENRQAIALAQEIDDRLLHASALNGLGLTYLDLGDLTEAVPRFELALTLAQEANTGLSDATWLRLAAVMEGNLCRAYVKASEYERAIVHGERGVVLRRRSGDRSGEALALRHLALAVRGLGDYGRAIDLCHEALAVGRGTPSVPVESVAEPLETLADCLHESGRTTEAIANWQEAATVFDHYGRRERAERIWKHLSVLFEGSEGTAPAGST